MDDINVESAFDAVARAALRRGEQDDDLYVGIPLSSHQTFLLIYTHAFLEAVYFILFQFQSCVLPNALICLADIFPTNNVFWPLFTAPVFSVPRDTVEINRTPAENQCAC